MYNKWQDVQAQDTDWYIACVKSGEPYEASAIIDAGNLLNTMRRHMGFEFLDKDILEFGSGNGRMTKYLREFFKQYYAVDISKTMLKLLKKKVDATTVESDGSSIAVEPVDIIFTFTVLMHNEKAKVPGIVEEFKRILRPGGYLFMQLPCYSHGYDRKNFDDVSLWTPQEIEELGKGFEILHIADSKRPMNSQISPEHFEYHVFRRVV
jgi:SAM-dependent methyltransferase